jgi:hypothetical protein
VLFCEADELNTVGSKAFDVFKGFSGAFARQPIKRPNQNQIELPLSRVREHATEFSAIRSASALVVNVFGCDFPSLGASEPA